MTPSTGWLVALAATLIVELYLLLRIARVLVRGSITLDLMFWTTWYSGMEVTATRAGSPLLYWMGAAGTLLMAMFVAAVFMLILLHL